MIPTVELYARLARSLEAVARQHGLPGLALVSDIPLTRLSAIAAGAEPTMTEYMVLDNLRTMQ